ncbi:MAG: hypothetical protein HQL93_04935 [Magnetococcales bacterium]|nr:hypothetical protein [Magnetococcales bacterium]
MGWCVLTTPGSCVNVWFMASAGAIFKLERDFFDKDLVQSADKNSGRLGFQGEELKIHEITDTI